MARPEEGEGAFGRSLIFLQIEKKHHGITFGIDIFSKHFVNISTPGHAQGTSGQDTSGPLIASKLNMHTLPL